MFFLNVIFSEIVNSVLCPEYIWTNKFLFYLLILINIVLLNQYNYSVLNKKYHK